MSQVSVSAAVREAERQVIGAMLTNQLNPHDTKLTGLEFSSPERQRIVLGCLAVSQGGSPIDLLHLSDYLNTTKDDYKEVAPTPQVLATFTTDVPANVRPAMQLIHSNQARTHLTRIAEALGEWVKDTQDLPLDIVNRTADQLDNVRKVLGQYVVNYKHVSEIAPTVEQQYVDMVAGINHNIPTGIEKIDNVTTGGGAKGDTWVLGAPTGSGKSALALSLMRHQAALNIPTMLVSREMLDDENYKRLHSSISGVPYYLMRPGMYGRTHDRLRDTMAQVNDLPIWIDDRSRDIHTICHNISEAVDRHSVRCVYIDYLQLVQAADKNQRAEMIGYCSERFKALAMEKRIWILLMAQYNRQAIYNKQIENSSFEGSGQIEKDASVILHLDLEKVEEGQQIPTWRKATLKMGKGRNAPQQSIELWFRGETFEFAPERPL